MRAAIPTALALILASACNRSPYAELPAPPPADEVDCSALEAEHARELQALSSRLAALEAETAALARDRQELLLRLEALAGERPADAPDRRRATP